MANLLPQVFVIRIWREETSGRGGSRRGYIEHIATGQRRYFSELIDALEFVAALEAMPFGPIVVKGEDDPLPRSDSAPRLNGPI